MGSRQLPYIFDRFVLFSSNERSSSELQAATELHVQEVNDDD